MDVVAKEERKGDKGDKGFDGEGEIRANGLENCGFAAGSSRVWPAIFVRPLNIF